MGFHRPLIRPAIYWGGGSFGGGGAGAPWGGGCRGTLGGGGTLDSHEGGYK